MTKVISLAAYKEKKTREGSEDEDIPPSHHGDTKTNRKAQRLDKRPHMTGSAA